MPKLHAQLPMGNVVDDWCRLELIQWANCPLGLLAALFEKLETMTLAENKLGLPQIVACMIAFTLLPQLGPVRAGSAECPVQDVVSANNEPVTYSNLRLGQ